MSFPDDFETLWLAERTGLEKFEAYKWRILFGSKYEDSREVVLRVVNTYLSADVPRAYVHAVTSFDREVCHPVEHSESIVEMYGAGIVPLYLAHARNLHPRTVIRLAKAGVPYEMIEHGTRASDFASVLIMLHRAGVPSEYAKPLFSVGYTMENAIGAWQAGIPLEFAMEVDGGLGQSAGAEA